MPFHKINSPYQLVYHYLDDKTKSVNWGQFQKYSLDTALMV